MASTSSFSTGGSSYNGLARLFSDDSKAARRAQQSFSLAAIDDAASAALFENRSRLRVGAGTNAARRNMDSAMATRDYAGDDELARQIGGAFIEAWVTADVEDFVATFRG